MEIHVYHGGEKPRDNLVGTHGRIQRRPTMTEYHERFYMERREGARNKQLFHPGRVKIIPGRTKKRNMTTDVRLTSGLTRTVFFIFLWRESIFLEKKIFPSEIRPTRRQRRHSTCLPYTTGGTHSQNKHDRHTYSRFRLLEDNSPRGS
jgi:hypothetical protein